MANMIYLYMAFGIVWLVFMVYILNQFRKRRALKTELETFMERENFQSSFK